MGRPTDYTPETAAEICARIADGPSLRKVCASDDMPARSTVFLWLAKHAEFAAQYAVAVDARADALFDDCEEIADDDSRDWEPVRNADGEIIGVKVDGEHVQRSKLRIDTRKWMAGQLAPKKYGPKLELGGKVTVSHEDALAALA